MSIDVRVVLVTAPDGAAAEALARTVVEEGLAACVNVVGGVVSIYRWEREVRRDPEVMLLMKTTAGGTAALCDRVVELHPYDVPEVLVVAVEGGHAPYLDWVRAEVGGRP